MGGFAGVVGQRTDMAEPRCGGGTVRGLGRRHSLGAVTIIAPAICKSEPPHLQVRAVPSASQSRPICKSEPARVELTLTHNFLAPEGPRAVARGGA